jgi:lipopolysaccharide/colanic/teichoic acid biosynthesis glycosyltransferase
LEKNADVNQVGGKRAMKRLLDILVSISGLVVLSPFLMVVMVLIWCQDYHSPLYGGVRIGKHGKPFRMIKLRSMIVGAHKTGVDSTAVDDIRITSIGHLIRKYKLDELTQLWNVLMGDMRIVGPRPNVKRGIEVYTDIEKELLQIKPGITDFASIVFSDESDILKGSKDPDRDYDQLIRPWKSRLGLWYIQHQSLLLDCRLILLTIVGLFSRDKALLGVKRLLEQSKAPADVIRVAKRTEPLSPSVPPGTDAAISSRGDKFSV